MKSFIETVTPSRDATCTTMTLHAAPRIVAFPASVELAASASQSCVERLGTTYASSNTAGTLLIRFDRSADRPTSQTRPPDRPPTVTVKPPWIAAESPETRTPSRTMNSPTKNRMMLQSTFAIRVLAVVFAKNGRKNRTNDPPARATRGSHAGVGDAKNVAATPTVTASVTTRPVRWSGTIAVGAVRANGAARSFRNASQTRPIATARHATVTGRRYAVNLKNGIPDWIAMNAFCGLPTSVAALPTFAAIATATRYGSGFTRRARVLRMTTGVTRSAIVSFKTMADKAAVATMSQARSEAWVFARSAIRDETRSKNPQTSRPDTRSTMPMRRTT